jgi:hypothetical protein
MYNEYMEIQEEKSEKKAENKQTIVSEYLIRKYGKEPRISEEELRQNQWNWH